MIVRQVHWVSATAWALLVVLAVPTTAFARFYRPAPHEFAPHAAIIPLDHATATLAFSPNGDGVRIVVEAIDRARRQILVQAYGFTEAHIIRALVRAHDRGVEVRVILDKSNETERYSGATYLLHHEIPTYIDDTVAIAHNKVMVIDADTVITGSFNFTKAAQTRNAENVLVISGSPNLATAYIRDWEWRRQYSHSYTGPRAKGGARREDRFRY